jgi:hypothetical protein
MKYNLPHSSSTELQTADITIELYNYLTTMDTSTFNVFLQSHSSHLKLGTMKYSVGCSFFIECKFKERCIGIIPSP